MIRGARQAVEAGWRNWSARMSARALTAMVVPGPDLARAQGLDLTDAGLELVGSPRAANVLVVIGDLPRGMGTAAAVMFAQMPRPRVILALGTEDVSPLPAADVRVAKLSQAALEGAVESLRSIFAAGAFDSKAPAFVLPMTEPQSGQDEQSEAAHHTHHEHSDHDGSQRGHGEHDGHGGMGFMSMVEMTKDLPRSSDGLAMEWLHEVPFGPCFPGLPGGLALGLTLDGDTIAEACARSAVVGHFRPAQLPLSASAFPDWLARLDPLAGDAYRLLGIAALDNAIGAAPSRALCSARAWRLERQRAISHLGWLCGFAETLGLQWLQQRAAALQRSLVRGSALSVDDALAQVRMLGRRLDRTPLLARRLAGKGVLEGDRQMHGPLAKAAGRPRDARQDEDTYLQAGFAPVSCTDGDVLARLQVRVEEIEQSLQLLQVFTPGEVAEPKPRTKFSGQGEARIETPRGTACLKITLERGDVQAMDLATPSDTHLKLVAQIAQQQELGDALLGIASLDLSPWEMLP